MEKEWKEGHSGESHKHYAATTFIEETGVVSSVPTELVGVFVTCNTNPCTVRVHDGPNAQSPVIADLDAQAARTIPFLPPEHILAVRGLYFVLSGDVKSVTIQWRPLPAGWRP